MRKYEPVLKVIFEQAEKELPKHIMDTPLERSILYRGYKIQFLKEISLYVLMQTRTSDYYKYVPVEEFESFKEKGMRVYADEEQMKRDEDRLTKYNKKIAASSKKMDNSMVIHWKKQRETIMHRLITMEESLKRFLELRE